ncbi:putative BAG domain-containing protein, partial [Globisporangium polare]
RLPANAFNMDHATQKLNEDDGTLEIRMPYYLVQHPRFFSPMSLFESPRCMVW